jgi:Putative phage abortive infection protein
MQNNETNRVNPKKPKEQSLLDKYAWVGFPIVFLLWLGYGFFQGELKPDSSLDRLNTLFSGLAFWGVIWAILLQKSELVLQREELELTRNEVRGQKEQLEAQNLTLKQQRFENTFFSLLNLFIGVVSSMEVTTVTEGRPATFKGRECFTALYNELQRQYTNDQHATTITDSKALCVDAYNHFADYRQMAVGHYFRTLYNIVKFIDRSPVEDKQTYINILRAQLSSSELNLLFYNCLSDYGSRKFKPYVEQFGLLENMMLSNLIRQDHKSLYNESAFKSQL